MVWLRERPALRRDRALARVPDRVTALSRFVGLAEPYLPPEAIAPAGGVVERAGARLALSGSHTVVALAGTTGSGKSSLFNAIAGTPLSPAGLRRPTTGTAHALTIGSADDAGPLLDWLGIPVRYTADGSPELDGLVLLDLPDIDSVERGHGIEADRLLELVDLVVWVLDPQKYADLTVHQRFRDTFRHHGDITVAVLNQADRLSPADRSRCLADLADILRADGLTGVPVLATSTVDQPGIDDLRAVLSRTVAARVAFLRRVAADVSSAVSDLEPVMAPEPVGLDTGGGPLVRSLAVAAGVPAVTAAARQSYVYRAARHAGWPLLRWTRRLRGDPLRRLVPPGSVGLTGIPPASSAAVARVSLATRELGEGAGQGLAPPWSQAMLDAARSRAGDVADALDVAVSRADLRQSHTPAWWRVLGVAQLLLFGAALAGLAWLAVRWALIAFALPTPVTPSAGRLPWPTVLLAGGLLGGLLLATLSRVPVALAARRHAARTGKQLNRAVAQVADELVIAPVKRVRDDYLAARAALAEAAR
jgi:GTP-binding protein EngB required for normal cell division